MPVLQQWPAMHALLKTMASWVDAIDCALANGCGLFFALAAGLLRTSVEGSTDSPNNQGHATEQWSLLFDGSLGAGLRLGDRFTLTVAAHAQIAEPYVAIHFVDAVVATSARPNFVLTLTVGAWL
jgi:hypothetical protein